MRFHGFREVIAALLMWCPKWKSCLPEAAEPDAEDASHLTTTILSVMALAREGLLNNGDCRRPQSRP